MARITETVESPLRDNALRTRTVEIITQLTGRMPYSAARTTVRWNEQRNIVIESETNMVSGNVRFTDGSPSTVRVTLDVDNGALRFISGGADRVRRDLREAAGQLSSSRAASGSSGSSGASGRRVLDTIEAIMNGITQGLTPAQQQDEEVENTIAAEVAADSNALAPAPSMRPSDIGGAKGAAIRSFQEQRAQGKSAQGDIPWGWIAGGAVVLTGGTALVLWLTRDKEEF